MTGRSVPDLLAEAGVRFARTDAGWPPRACMVDLDRVQQRLELLRGYLEDFGTAIARFAIGS